MSSLIQPFYACVIVAFKYKVTIVNSSISNSLKPFMVNLFISNFKVELIKEAKYV